MPLYPNSLRCQSLLSLKIYKMLRTEHRENQRRLNVYFQVSYDKSSDCMLDSKIYVLYEVKVKIVLLFVK